MSHVLAVRDFRLFLGGRFGAALALHMQNVGIGWYLYDLTGSALTLGYAGLAVFLPIAALTLPAGDLADRIDRRLILGAAYLTQALSAALLILLVFQRASVPALFYAVLAVSGVGRALAGPALPSFVPFLVSREQFASAVAWSSSANQTATVIGPAVGGLIYLLGPSITFAACCAVQIAIAAAMLAIGTRVKTAVETGTTALSRAGAGLRYLRRQPVVLGAITLDLFAVLLGGITALLPIYARDILAVGPSGLGIMRSGIAAGAVAMALVLAHLPARRQPHAGRAIFIGVALFGVAILVFGVSTSFVLSLAALAMMGAADMVSVFVRSTVVQLGTPDEMRGRVSAVHALFVSAANEFGEFRAGVVAAWLGAVPAVLAGGAATLVVVALWTYFFPELRRVARVTDVTAGGR